MHRGDLAWSSPLWGVLFFLDYEGMGKDVRYNDTREANELATGSKLLTLIRFLWRWCI